MRVKRGLFLSSPAGSVSGKMTEESVPRQLQNLSRGQTVTQTWVCSDFWETRTGLATVFLEMPRTGFEEEKEPLKTEEKFFTWGGETSFR